MSKSDRRMERSRHRKLEGVTRRTPKPSKATLEAAGVTLTREELARERRLEERKVTLRAFEEEQRRLQQLEMEKEAARQKELKEKLEEQRRREMIAAQEVAREAAIRAAARSADFGEW